MAVDPRGRIVHGTSLPNRVKLQERGKGWLVWDLDEIWRKLLLCARTTVGVVGKNSFVACDVASFSDDGPP
jgi:L-fuculokinase